MTSRQLQLSALTVALAAITSLSGCRMFFADVRDRDPATVKPLDAKYDYQDIEGLSADITKKLLGHAFFATATEKPVIAVIGIQNRTKSYIDMQALSDTISTKLLRAGKVRLVNFSNRNDVLKEQIYQLENATAETRAKIKQQLGADHVLTGSLTEVIAKGPREVRLSKKEDVYYQLTVKVTNVTSLEIAIQEQARRLRRASKPIIGW
jgi:PBP1b-binding outer membrane lipoprotein LpoB